MAPHAMPTNGESPEISPIHSDSETNGHRNGASRTNGTGGTNGTYGGIDMNLKAEKLAPIAIVGMGCRLPGDVSTPDEFWELCSRARSGCKFPEDLLFHAVNVKP